MRVLERIREDPDDGRLGELRIGRQFGRTHESVEDAELIVGRRVVERPDHGTVDACDLPVVALLEPERGSVDGGRLHDRRMGGPAPLKLPALRRHCGGEHRLVTQQRIEIDDHPASPPCVPRGPGRARETDHRQGVEERNLRRRNARVEGQQLLLVEDELRKRHDLLVGERWAQVIADPSARAPGSCRELTSSTTRGAPSRSRRWSACSRKRRARSAVPTSACVSRRSSHNPRSEESRSLEGCSLARESRRS